MSAVMKRVLNVVKCGENRFKHLGRFKKRNNARITFFT